MTAGDREAVEYRVRPLTADALHDVEEARAVDDRRPRPVRTPQRDRLAEEVDGFEVGAGCDDDLGTTAHDIDRALNRWHILRHRDNTGNARGARHDTGD